MTETKAPSPLRSAGALQNQIIIVGASHNSLIAAYYLARAGFKPLVLERRSIAGGACVTEEFHPGFRCSTLAGAAALIPQVLKDLRLERFGVEFIRPSTHVAALNLNGPPLCLYEDHGRTTSELNAVSAADANNYGNFVSTFA